MEYAVVLSAWVSDFKRLADEAHAFLQANEFNSHGWTVLLYGDDEALPQLVAQCPTQRVAPIKLTAYTPEAAMASLVQWHRRASKALYLFPGSLYGEELCPRLAFRLKGAALQAVSRLTVENDGIICTKHAYNGHIEAALRLRQPPFCLTMRTGQARDKTRDFVPEVVGIFDQTGMMQPLHIVSAQLQREAPQGYDDCKWVLVAGRGAGSKEGMATLGALARKGGGAVGVSRPVVMNAWAPMEQLIGVSGNVIRANLCIAAGVSGSCALFAGVKNCDLIVSVNTDPKAPIHQMSDLVVVEDCLEFMKALIGLAVG